ncbi:MAG: phage integrase N-terminal SAM-like domain-containing protein [Syntrophobacteria bacterium]
MSPRTSETYMHWTRRFQAYTHSKPPDQLTTEDVKGFLASCVSIVVRFPYKFLTFSCV